MLNLLDATPPTVAIYSHLEQYYVFFGVAAGVIVTAYMVYNIFKNRASKGRQAPKFHEEGDWGNWKGVLLTLCVTGSVLAFVEYQTFAATPLVVPPSDPNALHVNVLAAQWSWTFTYPNGYTTNSNLTVPAGRVVIINVTSKDVTHSFFVPELDVAKDAQPGFYNVMWFNATAPGVYTIQCKQLCGVGHAGMLGRLTVVSPDAFQKWYSGLQTGGK